MVTNDGQEVASIIDFYDRSTGGILDGVYEIDVKQTVSHDDKHQDLTYSQSFEVRGPRFSLPDNMVYSVHPPAGSTGSYGALLPHIILSRYGLPWERRLKNDDAHRFPWMAVLLFADGELRPGSRAGEVVSRRTVGQLLSSAEADVLIPDIAVPQVPESVRGSDCQTIDIPWGTFAAVMPRLADLPYLVHARRMAVSGGNGKTTEVGVIAGNRMPRKPGQYTAYLVSLEGLESYLDGADHHKDYVRLISLYSWPFASVGDPQKQEVTVGAEFGAGLLQLKAAPLNAPYSDEKTQGGARLQRGYVPVAYHTHSGECTFAWYRGPFTPVVPGTLPKKHFQCAEEALTYIQQDGVFDISYAAAWTLGSVLALANADLSASLLRARRKVTTDSVRLYAAQRYASASVEPQETMPGVPPLDNTTVNDAAGLRGALTPGRIRQQFEAALAEGLAARLTTAITTVSRSEPQLIGGGAAIATSPRQAAGQPGLGMGEFLARPEVRSILRNALRDSLGSSGTADAYSSTQPDGSAGSGSQPAPLWDAGTLLAHVPYSYLLPHASLVPPESLRFFHVDPHWMEALLDGILSIGLATSLEEETAGLLREVIAPADAGQISGVFLRSELVRHWSGLHLEAQVQRRNVPVLRQERVAPDTLLYLYHGTIDTIEIREPAHEVRMGVDTSDRIILRRLQSSTQDHLIGESLQQVFPTQDGKTIAQFLRPARADGFEPDVLNFAADLSGTPALVPALAQALKGAQQLTDTAALTPSGVALQLINMPYRRLFTVQGA
ncbi:hypothetical protein ACIQ9Q_41460 [Streptomyces sp. NPDC094438]|uniref:hypothetical protein n=1 Tax=Streptomyces sp. NPDC094438 TaxID=3366061 RepID=UPI00382F1676